MNFCAGDFEGEQRRGSPQVPGVLPSGKCAVAQPDGEATPGRVRCGERAPESRCHGRHHTVPGGRHTCSLLGGRNSFAQNERRAILTAESMAVEKDSVI